MFLLILASLRSVYRASTLASTTIDACVCVDDKLSVAHGDGSYRTFAFASTTTDARIIDYISHNSILLML